MEIHSLDSFDTLESLQAGSARYRIFSLAQAEKKLGTGIRRLPMTLRVLLENLLRHEDGDTVTADDIRALAAWVDNPHSDRGISLYPVRVVLPDSSGVPMLADVAAMRDAMAEAGDDPRKVNPFCKVDFIVDHAITAEYAGSADAYAKNLALEFKENRERYELVKWAQREFSNFRVIPPGAGIVHQVNLEHLSRPIWSETIGNERYAFPDSLVACDSHTPMINSLGVMGWGVGGIEVASALLGEAISMVIPEVVGCKLTGRLQPGVTCTDLALSVTQRLRAKGVIGKWVEFHGPGVKNLRLPDRATLSNMSPEYGATMSFFPIDEETLRYLELTGREAEDIALAEAYARAQGLWGSAPADAVFSDTLEIDLDEIQPSVSGPRLPQERHALSEVAASFAKGFPSITLPQTSAPRRESETDLRHGDVVIAAITSCTNTSNPAVLVAAGLLARNAERKGLKPKPWVKTSLSPGSAVVSEYLNESGLQKSLDALGFHVVGYGCMTCAGGSGSLPEKVSAAIEKDDLTVCAVLSGNRNFEGRIHPEVKAAYLASPPLVVAYAIAGTVLTDLTRDPVAHDRDGRPVYLKDIWPTDAEIAETVERHLRREQFASCYGRCEEGEENWHALATPEGATFRWDPQSSMLRRPPYFDREWLMKSPRGDFRGARVLAMYGDSITTDHIAPMGHITKNVPAAKHLESLGIPYREWGTYLLRRSNHDVLIRGAFANIRLRNQVCAPAEGGLTRHFPNGEVMSMYDAAERYAGEKVPMVVFAGKEYGCGSSRDWAAKGPAALGVRAIIAESFERIHRSNLVGMGVLPLQLPEGVSWKSLALDGSETIDISGISPDMAPRAMLQCTIHRANGRIETIPLRCRLDTRREIAWYRSGGILNYVFDQLRKRRPAPREAATA
jgi:aconitate hydratase